MKQKYTREQIEESIAHWKKVLESIDDDCIEESESLVDYDHDVLRCSARDLILEDADSLGSDVEAILILNTSKLPVLLDDEEISAVKAIMARDIDAYRPIIYKYVGKMHIDAKYADADMDIYDEDSYNEYVNPQSPYWQRDPENYDAEFIKAFPTYLSWIEYKTSGAVKELLSILSNSGRFAYQQASRNVRANQEGEVYVLIIWRA